ncbi:SMC-Scp complex subunit ScpB [Terricaulis silvestris]|uniref:Segregation and condensation protein B n=1 Tax=Terricaulis silvestris TaxID=2686094 RepID=A0A6I6MIC9_9CAUL|nr:SMC-Scp complex subunit ScpB [Terricaulis silvestris]QGZ94835.1 Segregation and condensation protein B [Terricaulis silvestris]
MNSPDQPVADQLRRLEDAFTEGGDRPRAEPSADAMRAAEALLFAGGEPITAKALGEKLGPAVDVATVLMKLKADYAERGVQLVEAGGAWRFQSAPDLSSLFTETREAPKRLPKAAMETLAVIAYHQPVTRAEIEEIRGVSLSRGSMELLLEISWIRPRGRRRTPGRPLTFGTTDAFLSQFGLASLDALPGKDDLKGLGLLDPRAASALDVPRPSEELASDEEPLSDGDDAASFFVDHMDQDE